MTVPHFYTSTPTTHSNAKKALFSRRLLDTASSLQMTTYYKKNSIPLQYLSLPENTFLKLSLVTSLKLSPALVTLFSTEPQGIKFQICPPSCDPILIRRKTILQVSTRPLAYHWEWSTATQHLAQSLHHCLPQYRIPKGRPSTFLPSQTNIPTFYWQRAPSIVTTDTLMTIMRPYPSQHVPPNWHTPFDKGDLIPCTDASTNLRPTYTSLLSRTSWSLTPFPIHFSSALQKSGIPNHVVFATKSGRTKPGVLILGPRQLYVFIIIISSLFNVDVS